MIKMPFQRCREIFHQSELRSVEEAKIGWKGVYSGLSPIFLLLKLPKLPDSKRTWGYFVYFFILFGTRPRERR